MELYGNFCQSTCTLLNKLKQLVGALQPSKSMAAVQGRAFTLAWIKPDPPRQPGALGPASGHAARPLIEYVKCCNPNSEGRVVRHGGRTEQRLSRREAVGSRWTGCALLENGWRQSTGGVVLGLQPYPQVVRPQPPNLRWLEPNVTNHIMDLFGQQS